MDLENNKIARELALDPQNKDKSPEDIARDALDKGLLIIRPPEVKKKDKN